MGISIIVAAAENNAIGKDNKLLWHLPADLKRFKSLTMGHPIIMGRKTFESIGRPLPGRTNIIITRNKDLRTEGVLLAGTMQEALAVSGNAPEIFITGGAEIYSQALPLADKIYLTRVHGTFEGDTFFPAISEKEWHKTEEKSYPADEKNAFPYTYITYIKPARSKIIPEY